MEAPSTISHTRSETAAFQSARLLTAIDALCKQFAEPGLQPIFFQSRCNLNCNTQYWPSPRNRQWEVHIATGHPLTVFLEKVCQEWYVACTTFLKHFHTPWACTGLPLPTSHFKLSCSTSCSFHAAQSSLIASFFFITFSWHRAFFRAVPSAWDNLWLMFSKQPPPQIRPHPSRLCFSYSALFRLVPSTFPQGRLWVAWQRTAPFVSSEPHNS